MFSHSAAQIKCVLIERVQVKIFGIPGDYRQAKPKTPYAKVKVQHKLTRVFVFCQQTSQVKVNVEKTNSE